VARLSARVPLSHREHSSHTQIGFAFGRKSPTGEPLPSGRTHRQLSKLKARSVSLNPTSVFVSQLMRDLRIARARRITRTRVLFCGRASAHKVEVLRQHLIPSDVIGAAHLATSRAPPRPLSSRKTGTSSSRSVSTQGRDRSSGGVGIVPRATMPGRDVDAVDPLKSTEPPSFSPVWTYIRRTEDHRAAGKE
jgi:hypothetical protein